MTNYILDEHGQPRPARDFFEWGAWCEKADRTVAKTTIGGALVSTVFLSIDHRFGGDGPPVLYETMIFGLPEDHPLYEHQDRYVSREEALIGHEEIVRTLREASQP